MKTYVRKWGNSLALRIPKQMAEDAGIREKTQVDVAVIDGQLVITPTTAPRYTLESLLANFDPTTIHDEIDTGPSVGLEAW
ncbi:MAG: AbrB/MazE/SpoVT family DNA-binding domain-containing protein [Armatimonadetes bacterium]|nr:AbrB/MazE/SpoVT family DNA-binding domain-containing protein [Anaerolineae bacterium]